MTPNDLTHPAEHLARARHALDLGDETAAVLWCSLCAEAAVDKLAERRGIDTRKNHFRRASLARRLSESGVLDDDLGDLLIRLNNERNHATYEGHQPDLRGRSWDYVLACLDDLVAAACRAEGSAERRG